MPEATLIQLCYSVITFQNIAYFNQVMGVEINPALCSAATENFALNNINNAKVIVCDSGRFANKILRTKKYIVYAASSCEPENSSIPDTAVTNPASDSIAAVSDKINDESTQPEQQQQHLVQPKAHKVQVAYGNKSTAQLRAAKNAERMQNKAKAPHIRKSPVTEKIPQYEFNFGAVLVDPPRCGLDNLTLSLVGNYDHIIYISCCPESLMRDLTQVRALLCTLVCP